MELGNLAGLCADFQAKFRSAIKRIGIARLVALGLVVLPPLMLLDWWLHFGGFVRFVNLVAYLALIGAAVWWTIVRPLATPWNHKQTLGYMDSVLPPERAMLLDLYELIENEDIQETQGETGKALADSAIHDVAPVAEQAREAEAVKTAQVTLWTRRAAIVLAVFVGLSVVLHEYAAIGLVRFFNPFSSLRWPHRTTIVIEEPERGWTIPAMESLAVKGSVEGEKPAHVVMSYRDRTTGHWIRENIEVRADDTFEYNFKDVREEIRFNIRGGDYLTETFVVQIIQRPYIRSVTAHYDYPVYAGIPNRSVASGQLQGLEGTKVRLEFESSMRLTEARYVFEDEEPVVLTLGRRGTTFEHSMFLEKEGSYRIELYEEHGYREPRPQVYEISVIPDNAPEVEIVAPGRNLSGTRNLAVNVMLRVTDDYGLEKVQFMYHMDGQEPRALDSRTAGGIPQRGTRSEHRFNWDLSRMEDLPQAGILRYFLRAKDVNPTGKGLVDSVSYEINLVRPSQYHLESIERARAIEAEARIAWENQLQAWQMAAEWAAKGTGAEDDPLWTGMTDRQNASIRAARAMNMHLRDLTAGYEQNRMHLEFMSARLNVVAQYLQRVLDDYHKEIEQKVRDARPQTAAEAAEAALKGKRAEAYAAFKDHQKFALLNLEMALKRIFDWRDLQISAVRTTLLHEEQEEVLVLTREIAPRLIGLETGDIQEKDLDALMTLGARQKTMLDVETEVENQLVHMQNNARLQKRTSIQEPLEVAYEQLRSHRVNEFLDRAAKAIANNQPYQIIKDQEAALHALNIVKGGLILAGQRLDEDPAITLAMVPVTTLGQVVEVPKPGEGEDAAEPVQVADAGGAPPERMTWEDMIKALPVGSDRLSMALDLAWSTQDSVLARTRYLNDNSSEKEMPRYIRLKRFIIQDFQNRAVQALDVAVKEADKPEDKPLAGMLGQVRTEFLQSLKLVEEQALQKHTQQLQADAMSTLKDAMSFVSQRKLIGEAVEENKRRGGKDAFDRRYIVRDKNLDEVAAMTAEINHATLLQNDVLRKVRRFAEHRPQGATAVAIEKVNRGQAEKSLAQATKIMQSAVARVEALTPDMQAKVLALGIGEIRDYKGVSLANLEKDAAAAIAAGEQAMNLLARAMQNIRGLLDERELSAEEVAATKPVEHTEMTQEEWEKRQTAAYILERIRQDVKLPAELREIMIRALSHELPSKHKALISAYYASFLEEGGTQ